MKYAYIQVFQCYKLKEKKENERKKILILCKRVTLNRVISYLATSTTPHYFYLNEQMNSNELCALDFEGSIKYLRYVHRMLMGRGFR